MFEETLQWRRCVDEKPDADLTVLLYCPDFDEPIWPGALDGEDWVVDGWVCDPTHWAPMPLGPR